MEKNKLRQILTLAAVVGSVVLVYVGSRLLPFPWNEENRSVPANPVEPAGFVFGIIWSFIYVGAVALSVYQALPAQRNNPRFWRMGYWLAISLPGNAAWILLVGSRQFLAAYGLQLFLFYSALVIHQKLEIGKTPVRGWEKWLRVPMSVYAGWLTVANIPATASILQQVGWNGAPLTPITWAVVLLAAALPIVYLTTRYLHDPVYMIPLLIAYVGIAVKQAGVLIPLSVGLCLVGMGLLVMEVVRSKSLPSGGRSLTDRKLAVEK